MQKKIQVIPPENEEESTGRSQYGKDTTKKRRVYELSFAMLTYSNMSSIASTMSAIVRLCK